MTYENWNVSPYRMENPTKALWALGERGVSLDRGLGRSEERRVGKGGGAAAGAGEEVMRRDRISGKE